jgi:dethiobiotin synthetase
MSPRVVFVAGAHTEIGKTHAACGLLRAAREVGWSADALKPVVSGFDALDWNESDPGRLLAAMGRDRSLPELDRLSPWRLAAPLAPPMAAKLESRALPIGPVIEFCRGRIETSPAELMVVEGVGGLMSPIADGATSLDLLEALDASSVLVGGAYLGAVSHTLTALEVMRARGRAPAALLISQDAASDAPDFAGTVSLAAAHAGPVPVIPIPRRGDPAWAARAFRALGFPGRYSG